MSDVDEIEPAEGDAVRVALSDARDERDSLTCLRDQYRRELYALAAAVRESLPEYAEPVPGAPTADAPVSLVERVRLAGAELARLREAARASTYLAVWEDARGKIGAADDEHLLDAIERVVRERDEYRADVRTADGVIDDLRAEIARVRTNAGARVGVPADVAVRALAEDRDACARERDEARAEVERLRADVERLTAEREERDAAAVTLDRVAEVLGVCPEGDVVEVARAAVDDAAEFGRRLALALGWSADRSDEWGDMLAEVERLRERLGYHERSADASRWRTVAAVLRAAEAYEPAVGAGLHEEALAMAVAAWQRAGRPGLAGPLGRPLAASAAAVLRAVHAERVRGVWVEDAAEKAVEAWIADGCPGSEEET